MAKEICKGILWVLVGIILAVGITCLVICIGAAVNGVSFAQQIVNWFGPKAKEVKEVAEAVVQTFSAIKMVA